MKTTKHTPGPYTDKMRRKDRLDNVIEVRDSGGFLLALFPRKDRRYETARPVDERDANVDLFLAAPELLTALVDTLDALHNETHGQDDTPWIEAVKDRARTLIAKATGEE